MQRLLVLRRCATCQPCDIRLRYDPGVNNDNQPTPEARLKTLLKEGGFKSTRLDAKRRLVMFSGRTRDWTLIASIYNGWLNIQTYVCEIPQVAGLRVELLDAAMSANQRMSLTKFTKADNLILELEYREEHLDAQVLNHLLQLMHANAEEYYPRLFRVVTGDSVLESLAKPDQLSEAA